MEDKLIVVYEGSYAQYRSDWLKDEYVNKLVIVTGEQSSSSAEARKSYLCVSNGEKSVAIPIPSVYLQGIMVDGAKYGYPDGYIRFAEANGVSISVDAKTGDLNIGISEELSTQLATLNDTIDTVSNTADGAVQKANLANMTALGAVNTADKASAKATEVEGKADSASTKADSALTQLSGVVGDVQTAKDTANEAKAIAQQAKDKANTNEKNITSIGGDVKTLGNILITLNTTITQVSTKADNAVSQAESASTKADDAKELAETASQNADKANKTISGISNTVSSLGTTVEGHTSEIADIEGDVAENKAKIEAIEEDYISKGEAVDFATDLTGVVEATAEEFVYRPSAGDKSIRDKSAVIRRIKGNSVVWEQKLQAIPKREDFEGATTYYDYDANECVVQNISRTSNYISGSSRWQIKPDYYTVPNHVYLLLSDKDYVGVGVTSYTSGFQNVNTIKKHTGNDIVYFRIDKTFDWANVCPVGSEIRFRMMFFDLTAMFGAGNEPATVEEFRAVYNDAYYPYCQPELRGVKTGAIKTVGFNLFDGECARVIGGMSYIVSNYTSASYSETKGGPQTIAHIKDGIYTPECSGYLYLTGTADATPCVHFQHSGVMDGECAPYEEHILNLPEILKLFPNGMHAVGDVFDEINIDTYIQRCEYRDYVEGDESNAEVLTDGVHTVAKLTNPIITPLSEPITLDYYCEDWGSEEAIPASSASAPFRADIVYQFNAEGRIRDNSRNIDKLERIVAPLKNVPSNVSLATQDFVLAHIPTRVATATERIVVTVGKEKQNLLPNGDEIQYLLPNMLYDYGATSYDKIELPNLLRGDVAFNNKWMVRFASISSDNISIPFDVLWKDGIAPSWSAWCLCEMTFFKDAEGLYVYGEWKIYK